MAPDLTDNKTQRVLSSGFSGSSSRVDRDGSTSSMGSSVNRVEILVYLRYEKDSTRELLIRLDCNATVKKLVSEALIKNSTRRSFGSFARSRVMSLAMDLRSSKAQTCIHVYEKESGKRVDMDTVVDPECMYIVDLTEEAKMKTAFQSSGVSRQQPKQESSEVCNGDVFLVLSADNVKQKRVSVACAQTVYDAFAKALETESLNIDQLYNISVKDQLEREVKLDAVVCPNFFYTANLTHTNVVLVSNQIMTSTPMKDDNMSTATALELEELLEQVDLDDELHTAIALDETFDTDFMDDEERQKTILECGDSCDESEHEHKLEDEVKTAIYGDFSEIEPVSDLEEELPKEHVGGFRRVVNRVEEVLVSLISKLPFVSTVSH